MVLCLRADQPGRPLFIFRLGPSSLCLLGLLAAHPCLLGMLSSRGQWQVARVLAPSRHVLGPPATTSYIEWKSVHAIHELHYVTGRKKSSRPLGTYLDHLITTSYIFAQVESILAPPGMFLDHLAKSSYIELH